MQILGIRNSSLVSLRESQFSNKIVPVRSTKASPTVLSTTPNSSNILLDSFLNSRKKVATVELGTAVAGLRVNDTFQFLNDRFKVPKLPVTENLQNRPETETLKSSLLKDIKNSLENLSLEVDGLKKPGSLNTRLATSSRRKVLEATATSKSPFGTFSVKPERTANGSVLVSDKQDSSVGPLGLSGNFTINGFQVTVESTDTLLDIKNKINLGEDTNGNGVLDPAEDRNENNISETLEVPPTEVGPGVYIIEDINDNGVLEPAEDVNKNNILDGGTNEIKVIATIQSERLVLTSTVGATRSIDLVDDDNILLSLGFFQLNFKNQPFLKEQQIDFSFNPPKDLNQAQRTAKIDVNGTKFFNNTNIFDNAINETQLDIKRASRFHTKVKIFSDPNETAEQIKSFFEKFNAAMKKINNALQNSSLFASDKNIQRIRKKLLDNSQNDIQKINEVNRAIDKVRGNRENNQNIGLKNVNNKKSIVQEVALTRIVQNTKNGITLPFKITGIDLLRRLSSIGILTESDDTVKVIDAQLKRALTINPNSVLSLFTNSKTGLLPRLEKELSRVLKTDLGDIDLKQNEIKVKPEASTYLAKSFKHLISNTTFNNKVQNLIAVA